VVVLQVMPQEREYGVIRRQFILEDEYDGQMKARNALFCCCESCVRAAIQLNNTIVKGLNANQKINEDLF
jgi:hypothetical protein